MDKRKLTKSQLEIEHEIDWYETSKDISKIMRRLGKLGFKFSGHGTGFGGEDFNFIKRLGRQNPKRKLTVYVNISDRGRFPKCSGNIYDDTREDWDNYLVNIKEINHSKFFPVLKKALKQFDKVV